MFTIRYMMNQNPQGGGRFKMYEASESPNEGVCLR